MESLTVLIWFHMMGDYPLQGDFLSQMKGKNDYLLFCHSVIWTGCIAVGLILLGILAWWKIGMLLIGHFAIDRWKARKKDKTHALTRDLYIDQVGHLAQLALCLF
jgi:hypothetical protein